jgi:hypothetical protein
MVHCLSTLGTLFRRAAAFNVDEIKAAHATVVAVLPKKNFTPFTVWEKTLDEISLTVSDEAIKFADTMGKMTLN